MLKAVIACDADMRNVFQGERKARFQACLNPNLFGAVWILDVGDVQRDQRAIRGQINGTIVPQ
jgi:hypothetical protein